MIKALLFFLAFLGGAAVAQTAPSPAPKPVATIQPPSYFFTIAMDPRYQFVGSGALTEEDAAKAKCYRFITNSNGKLRQIEYRCAGVPMPDPLLGVARIDFEYQPGIERRWFRDAQGQPVRDVDDIQGEEITLNAAGYPTDITNLDNSGGHARDNSGVIQYVRTLDDHNRVVKLRRIGLFGTAMTDDNGYFETRTTYDAQSRPMERGNYDASGSLLNNNEGVALVRTIYTIYPDATQSIESYFDASSLAVEEKSSGVHLRQRALDPRGFLIDESYFDALGAPTDFHDDNVHERRFTYDERGNKLSESFFDGDGKPVNQKSPDFARVVYKYDDKNRVIEEAYFGDDGAPQIPQKLGYAILRQEYDDRGNIVRQQFFDGQGHPSLNVKYGAPAIRIEVDGDTTIVRLRDGKDQPMKNAVNGYYFFSYKTGDYPLSRTNHYYNRHGRHLSYFPRISVINPHLHALASDRVMEWSARLGASAAGLGGLLGCFIALRKSSHTKRRKVYVPTPLERFLGWLAVFCILEGCLRFFMTVYWAWVNYENGRMGYGFYVLETIFIIYLLYRLLRFSVTMRVLNIGREDIHRLVRDFFAKVNLKPEWIEARKTYVTPALGVRVRFFGQKYHAYIAFVRQQYYSPIFAVFSLAMVFWLVCFQVFSLSFVSLYYVIPAAMVLAWLYARVTRRDLARYREGRELARDLTQFIRAQVGGIQAPVRTRAIALYYPSVAFCYFLFAGVAFYTVWQLVKGF
jgi:YD repeat-containing protein